VLVIGVSVAVLFQFQELEKKDFALPPDCVKTPFMGSTWHHERKRKYGKQLLIRWP
jgi:hypothetical protein